jgi:hypothetical protein
MWGWRGDAETMQAQVHGASSMNEKSSNKISENFR